MADGNPLIAWQPVAGAVASFLPMRKRSPLVLLNPLLDPDTGHLRQGILRAGCRRAQRTLFYSRQGLEYAGQAGLSPSRTAFVALGVHARYDTPPPPGTYLLAAGRSARDWVTLSRAAAGLDAEILVMGPTVLPEGTSLRRLPQSSRTHFFSLLTGAAALVVPLLPVSRTAGQLAVLDSFSVGRAVVATRSQGTEDYVDDRTGILVPPSDPEALRAALGKVLADGTAARLGAGALAAAKDRFSLRRFVEEVDRQVRLS
jgi:glycosyltransferase involved in cell wall biosynthesis